MLQENPSNDELIESIANSLRGNVQTDAPLLEILIQHILSLEVGPTAAEDAAEAIEQLAKRRAEDNKHDHTD